jgi:alpha-D-xyloside xylohydrolase
MDFTSDPAVFKIGDQYMFGPALLICPVYAYQAREREVYFPKGGGWYDFYTGRFIQGGKKMTVPAPYEKMPLFVKAGSILPIGPELEFASQKLADPVFLYIYTGADGTFTLYEDEDDNYNYEQGKYSTISFSYHESTGELTIGERKGEFPGMLDKRMFHVVWVSKDSRKGYDPDRKPSCPIRYTGQTIKVKK